MTLQPDRKTSESCEQVLKKSATASCSSTNVATVTGDQSSRRQLSTFFDHSSKAHISVDSKITNINVLGEQSSSTSSRGNGNDVNVFRRGDCTGLEGTERMREGRQRVSSSTGKRKTDAPDSQRPKGATQLPGVVARPRMLNARSATSQTIVNRMSPDETVVTPPMAAGGNMSASGFAPMSDAQPSHPAAASNITVASSQRNSHAQGPPRRPSEHGVPLLTRAMPSSRNACFGRMRGPFVQTTSCTSAEVMMSARKVHHLRQPLQPLTANRKTIFSSQPMQCKPKTKRTIQWAQSKNCKSGQVPPAQTPAESVRGLARCPRGHGRCRSRVACSG